MTINFTFWLGMALCLSVAVNIGTIWYIRKLLSRFMFISNNLSDLVEMIKNFRDHLKSIYEMEMFYGDETLQFLMSHTKSLFDLLQDYEDVYLIAEPLEEDDEFEENNKEEQLDGETKKVTEENVLYAGTRRRNN